jgi:hypothetical protein
LKIRTVLLLSGFRTRDLGKCHFRELDLREHDLSAYDLSALMLEIKPTRLHG